MFGNELVDFEFPPTGEMAGIRIIDPFVKERNLIHLTTYGQYTLGWHARSYPIAILATRTWDRIV